MTESTTTLAADQQQANLAAPASTTFQQISKRIVRLALPMAGTQLITVASSFLCMAMLATLGHQVLAASALIFATQMTVLVICMSFLFSLSLFIGHAYGAKNYIAIGNYIQQGWTFALLISIPIILFFWHIAYFLILFGQAPALAQLVQTFFHAFVWGVAPVLLLVCNQQLYYGIHKQRIITYTSCISVTLLLISAYILILGKFGMPSLGVAGLGYAIAIQCWFSFIFTTSYMYYKKEFKPFDLFHYRVHKEWQHITRMFKVSWPISLQMGGEMLAFFTCSTMIGWLGTNALAAYQVVGQYLFLIIVPIFSLTQASGILVGQACGGKQFHEIKRLGYACISLAIMLSGLVAVVFLMAPRSLAAAYLDIHNPANAETLHLVILFFIITAFSQILDAVRNVTTGVLRGLFDTRFPMYAGLLAIWLVGIPLSYLLAFPLHIGAIGIAIGFAIGIAVGATVVMLRWRVMSNRQSPATTPSK